MGCCDSKTVLDQETGKSRKAGEKIRLVETETTEIPQSPPTNDQKNSFTDEKENPPADEEKTRWTVTNTQLGPWIVGNVLGEGHFAKVYKGTHDISGEFVALKIIEENAFSSTQLQALEIEKKAMQTIKHPNVIQLKDYKAGLTFKGKKVIVFVVELASSDNLFEWISLTGKFDEKMGRTYFHQLINGLSAAHNENICHRDLKPENLLMDEEFQLRIADFGLAHTIDETKNLYTTCGTDGYMAPEVVTEGGYDGKLADIWSCGVILFIMLSGHPPFGNFADGWFDLLNDGNYEQFWYFQKQQTGLELSVMAMHFINKILCVNPSERLNINAITDHEWFQSEVYSKEELKNKCQPTYDRIHAINIRDQETLLRNGDLCRSGDDLELPILPSIIMVEKLVEEKEEIKDENEEDEDEDDLIRVVVKKNSGPAPPYNPTQIVFTKFKCQFSADIVFARLMYVFNNYPSLSQKLDAIKEDHKNYTIDVTVDAIKGEIRSIVKIFVAAPEESDSCFVEFRRIKGENTGFLNVFAYIKKQMNNLKWETSN